MAVLVMMVIMITLIVIVMVMSTIKNLLWLAIKGGAHL